LRKRKLSQRRKGAKGEKKEGSGKRGKGEERGSQ
jgi:hypothetical protein